MEILNDTILNQRLEECLKLGYIRQVETDEEPAYELTPAGELMLLEGESS